MEPPQPIDPHNFVAWVTQNLEQRGRLSVLPNNTRYSVDPRVSHERHEQLKSAFEAMDADNSGKLSLEEILRFLHEMNDEVEEDYIRRIFESMDRNGDGAVSIDEFIAGYLDQVNGLGEAASRLKQSISDKQTDLKIYSDQLEEARRTEKINAYNIMEGSQLTVNVVEAQNIAGPAARKPRGLLTLQCEKQKISTQPAESGRNPMWNETFSFKISMGNGELLLQIFDQQDNGKKEYLGSSSILIQDFTDQMRHERWLQVKGKSGSARVFVRIQWIHHKTTYYETVIADLKHDITIDSAELSRIEYLLRKLGTNPMGMFERDTWQQQLENRVIAHVEDFTDKHFRGVGSFKMVQRVLLTIFFSLTLLMSFTRPDLLNVTCLCYLILNEVTGARWRELRVAAVLLLCAAVSDAVWVFDDLELLVFELHDDPTVNVERASFFFGFCNFVLKALLFPVVVKNALDARAQEASS